jgi:LysR family nitrogen assimilation transcriptional regulator
MDLRQLRYFLSIVEQGSVTRAADVLHVAQPSLSLHLKELETEFGCQLMHRTTRGMVPTESGLRLARRAQVLVEEMKALVDEVRGKEVVPVGQAVIGIPDSLGTVLTVPLIKAMRSHFPGVRLRVVEALSGHMQEWLLSGKEDLAVVFDDLLPGVTGDFLFRESLCLVGPCGDQWLQGRRQVEMDQAIALPLIMPSRPHGVREEVERAAGARRRTPNIVVELDALDQIKALVADGLGYTVLSERFAGHGAIADRLATVPIVNPSIDRTISLARAADRPLSMAAKAVQGEVLELFAGRIKDGRWSR